MYIEKIIHQVWEGRMDPEMPDRLQILAESWKKNNPGWKYHLWNGDEMDNLVKTHFPQYLSLYQSFKCPVQRWDVIRYMILYVEGGVYTDLDTECYKSIDPLLENKKLCFGEEPPEHHVHTVKRYVGNAFMASEKGNEAWLELLKDIEQNIHKKFRTDVVLNTTGPLIISRNIDLFEKQYNAEVLSYLDVTPLAKHDVINYITGKNTSTFKKKIEKSYCAHYFFGSWEKEYSIY